MAFGRPVEFGLEGEGSSPGILRYYRPHELSDAEWTALPISRRLQILDERAGLRRGIRNGKLDGHRWAGLEKLESAPEFLPQELDFEPNLGSYEIHVEALNPRQHWEQREWLAANVDRQMVFHDNILFHPPRRPMSPSESVGLAAFLAHANEHATLLALRGEPVDTAFPAPANFEKSNLRLPTAEQLAQLEEPLVSGQRWPDTKTWPVGLRTKKMVHARYLHPPQPPYRKPGYFGIELRGVNNDPLAAKLLFANTLHALQAPGRVKLKLGFSGEDYAVQVARGMERAGEPTRRALQTGLNRRLAKDKEAQRIVRELLTERFSNDKINARQKVHLYGLPMVPWEQRPYLHAHAEAIATARSTFLASVAQGVREAKGRGTRTQQVEAARTRLERAVQVFLRQSHVLDFA